MARWLRKDLALSRVILWPFLLRLLGVGKVSDWFLAFPKKREILMIAVVGIALVVPSPTGVDLRTLSTSGQGACLKSCFATRILIVTEVVASRCSQDVFLFGLAMPGGTPGLLVKVVV